MSNYPVKPVPPLDEDCCGSGCQTCVFDLYELDVKRWQINCSLDKNELSSSVEEVFSIYEYKPFRICGIDYISDTLICYRFDLPCPKLPIHAGEHLVARCCSDDGRYVIRPYTPLAWPGVNYQFCVFIKLYESGVMSKCIKTNWSLGKHVHWRGPYGDFVYTANEVSHLVMLAGGTGVAPMLSIISEVLANEDDTTVVHLVYSTYDAHTVIAKKELREWNAYWNCNIVYCLTRAQEGRLSKMAYEDEVQFSRINERVLHPILMPIQRKKETLYKVLVCGSTEFNEAITSLLETNMHVNDKHIVCF